MRAVTAYWFRFVDGIEGEIDLETLLWGPMFEPLKGQGPVRSVPTLPRALHDLLAQRRRPRIRSSSTIKSVSAEDGSRQPSSS